MSLQKQISNRHSPFQRRFGMLLQSASIIPQKITIHNEGATVHIAATPFYSASSYLESRRGGEYNAGRVAITYAYGAIICMPTVSFLYDCCASPYRIPVYFGDCLIMHNPSTVTSDLRLGMYVLCLFILFFFLSALLTIRHILHYALNPRLPLI